MDAICEPPSPVDPFLTYPFLKALEDSESVGASAGWVPYHLQVKDAEGAVQGVMPLYLKGHSQGEYIFDYSWADAFERAGGRYYPKLLSAIPLLQRLAVVCWHSILKPKLRSLGQLSRLLIITILARCISISLTRTLITAR